MKEYKVRLITQVEGPDIKPSMMQLNYHIATINKTGKVPRLPSQRDIERELDRLWARLKDNILDELYSQD